MSSMSSESNLYSTFVIAMMYAISVYDQSCYNGTRPGGSLNIEMLWIPMLKIRRSCDRLIFNMGIPIPRKDGLYIETGPRSFMRGK